MTVHGSAIVNVGMCAVGLGTKVNKIILSYVNVGMCPAVLPGVMVQR